MILFGSERGPLRRVDAAGGACATVVIPNTAPRGFPIFLPDGNHFLYNGVMQGVTASRGVYLAALDNLEPRKMLADNSGVVYSPPVAGGLAHLLFLRDDTLMAQPFDQAKLEGRGRSVPGGFAGNNHLRSATGGGICVTWDSGLRGCGLDREPIYLVRSGGPASGHRRPAYLPIRRRSVSGRERSLDHPQGIEFSEYVVALRSDAGIERSLPSCRKG